MPQPPAAAESLVERYQRVTASAPKIQTLDELKQYLQLAVELELFTLPPYLTAMWSLKNQTGANGFIFRAIRDIAMQEMLHMGLACNLLAAVGGSPKINAPESAPCYPSRAPGLALETEIELQPLSLDAIRLFMKIEEPEEPIPPTFAERALEIPRFPTIGEFYDAIARGLTDLNPEFKAKGQIEREFRGEMMFIITDLAKALEAIKVIKEQGEGTSQTQSEGDVIAHYYRFQQIELGYQYVKQADGTWKLDRDKPLPFPTPDQVHPMAKVPPGGYPDVPEAVAFDQTYSLMLERLQAAWTAGDADIFEESVSEMYSLASMARQLMSTPRDPKYGPGHYGPAFRLVPLPAPDDSGGGGQAMMRLAHVERAVALAAPVVPGYARIQLILDEAVNHQNFGGHRAFWRGLSRDQFVNRSVFGVKLIVKNADGSFNPDESGLVKALEGRPPFGVDLVPPPAGAIFNRMPMGFDPVPQDRINEIRAWIAAGCPEIAPIPTIPWFDPNAGGPADSSVHIAYWRDFDSWALFDAQAPVPEDINVFFEIASGWLDFAKDSSQEVAWAQSLANSQVQEAVARLEARQRATVEQHYGRPIPLLTLLDSLERFGDDSLPDDPQRPENVRHSMDGRIMWFFWSAFADASLRISASVSSIPSEFWRGMSRAILLGLINDGLFRGRFAVTGFTADDLGKEAARQHVRALADADIPAELAKRYRESGL